MQVNNSNILRIFFALSFLSIGLLAEGQSITSSDPYPCLNQLVIYTYNGGCSGDTWTIPGTAGIDYQVVHEASHRRELIWKTILNGEIRVVCEGAQLATTNVYVNRSGPNYFTTVDPLTSICQGTAYTDFKITNYNNNATSFEWISTAAESVEVLPDRRARLYWKPTFSGTATIIVRAQGSCGPPEDTESTLTISPAPNAANLAGLEFCEIERPLLKSNLTTFTSYNWYTPDGTFIGTGLQQPYKSLRPGSYTFLVETIKQIDGNNCTSQSKGTLPISILADCADEKLNRTTSSVYNYAPQSNQPVLIGNSKSYYGWSGELLQAQAKSLSTGKVLAAETVSDKFGRQVISSLPAPTASPDFKYRYHFMLNENGYRYSHEDFGQPLGATESGTVGWYYSNNYSTDKSHPKSQFPFSQAEHYSSDIGGVKRSGGVGEALQIGEGHEIWNGSFQVFSELTDYLQRQSELFPLSNQKGILQTVTRDQNGLFSISISSTTGNLLMSALGATQSNALLTINNQVTSSGNPSSGNFRTITYFYILEPQTVTITGSQNFIVEDILNDERKSPGTTFAGQGGVWPAGFYRIILTHPSSEIVLSYTNHLRDISYSFYDDRGRVICDVSPNGVVKLINPTPGQVFSDIDKTLYKFNFKGQLTEQTETDAGTSKFLYRKDGNIRFSQNALQLLSGRFSYTNYDEIGRPVESGEYTGTQETFIGLATKLEYAEQVTYGDQTKKDWSITEYDKPDQEFVNAWPNSPYKQTFVRGGVSRTLNAHSRTWYSFDELGRTTWIARKPTKLNLVFVTTYLYDFSGNVLRVSNFTYDWTSHALVNQFHHHYEYDFDQRLSKVYTSTEENSDQKLRAAYYYYLHGPLKRIELGKDLQGVDFVYSIQGWLTHINNPDTNEDPGKDAQSGVHANFRKDAFGMVLDYYQSDMTGLYQANANNPHDPSLRHRLPSSEYALSKQQPLIHFAPELPETGTENTSFLKGFSAENPVYKKQIESITPNR
jgi:hypothetical protein